MPDRTNSHFDFPESIRTATLEADLPVSRVAPVAPKE
jgi:hypothetical protein